MAERRQVDYIPGISPARPWNRLDPWDVLLAAVIAVVAAAFCWKASAAADHAWEWRALMPYLAARDGAGCWHAGLLLRGLLGTLRLGLWSTAVALASGVAVGVLSARLRGAAALPAMLYVSLMRNTPPLVLLFLMYFFAGSMFAEPLQGMADWVAALPGGLRSFFAAVAAPPEQLDRMAAAVLTLGLYSGAYVAEIVRAGIESVDQGQWEAASSLGMGSWNRMRLVIIPQAVPLMIPPLTGQCISIFKETALASVISVPELTFQSLEVMAVSRMTFELWLATAALYCGISLALAAMGRRLEKRVRP
jgi:polar amino acid transport system permease protein